jgi:hypothetical protein
MVVDGAGWYKSNAFGDGVDSWVYIFVTALAQESHSCKSGDVGCHESQVSHE